MEISIYIYLIPKINDWNYDITQTRLIILLDVVRKSLVKVITNRLSIIIAKNNVLKGGNFAGIPGGSTFEPLRILNSIIENANNRNKELWILLQDLSKAYD